jgi:membrane-bound metal-dependent hydrolase YbcI (DUF457 family)
LTVYEHIMLGGSLALASGLQRRYGWGIVALAGVAAALPDLDGLSIAFGPEAYANAHRVWGHNLLVAGGMGAAAGAFEFKFGVLQHFCRSAVFQKNAGTQLEPPAGDARRAVRPPLAVWTLTGVLAAYSHLAADLVYSYGNGHPWPLPLLWPFSRRNWVIPVLRWGDLGATLLFIAEMFALYRWPSRATGIAWLTLMLVSAYVGARWVASI